MSSFTRGAWQTEQTENGDSPRLELLGQPDFYRDVVKPVFDRSVDPAPLVFAYLAHFARFGESLHRKSGYLRLG